MLVLDDYGLDIEASGSIATDEADAAFLEAVRAKNRSAWLIGDLYATDCISSQALDETTISLQTVRNYASVCSAYPKQARKIPVSFSHYESCAALMHSHPTTALTILSEAHASGLDRNWCREQSERMLGQYHETAEILLVFRATDGVFVPSGAPSWLPDGFTRTITARRE